MEERIEHDHQTLQLVLHSSVRVVYVRIQVVRRLGEAPLLGWS